jgi:DsbC/DsbD-like thiol-disulfide interchange protein
MKRAQILGTFLLGLTLIGATWTLRAEAGEKSDSKVKVTAKAGKLGADGKQTVAIDIAIDKGWYIYANPVKSEDFEDNRTSVTIKAKGKIAADVKYPEGKLKDYGKIKFYIYQDKVTIEAQVKRTPGDTSPLEVSVAVNSCSEKGVCLLPATVKLTVP